MVSVREVREMNDQRQVLVRAETRRVTVSGPGGGQETLSYPGVTLMRVCGGLPDGELWLPMGEQPSEADDEALIVALRAAYLWRLGRN